jgi:hypothetical protein
VYGRMSCQGRTRENSVGLADSTHEVEQTWEEPLFLEQWASDSAHYSVQAPIFSSTRLPSPGFSNGA